MTLHQVCGGIRRGRLWPVTVMGERPWRKPRVLYADRGFDHDLYRRRLRERGIVPKMAQRGQRHGSGLGRVRCVPSLPLPGSTAIAAYEPAGKDDL